MPNNNVTSEDQRFKDRSAVIKSDAVPNEFHDEKQNEMAQSKIKGQNEATTRMRGNIKSECTIETYSHSAI